MKISFWNAVLTVRDQRFILRFLSTLSLLLVLTLPSIESKAETIHLCYVKSDDRPWQTIDGDGLNTTLLNMVAKRLGITFKYEGVPFKRCLAMLKANEVSGTIGASFKSERLEFGEYPGGKTPDANKRLNINRYVVLRKKGSRVDWDGKIFLNLEGAVGIQFGYSVGEMLRGVGVTVDEGTLRSRDLALKLIAGNVGAAAMLSSEATYLLDNDPKLASQLEILPIPLIEKPYFLMLSHALVASRPDFAAKIWNTIEEVRNSSVYQKIEREAFEKNSR